MNAKKSILIYFDNYPMLNALPPEQRGWLLSALMVYGDRLSRDGSVTLEEILEQFPRLSPEARLACGFMGTSILRDTQKWLNRQQRGSAGQNRLQKSQKPAPEEKAAADRRAVEDMERVRRMMERFREEEKQDA